VELSLGFKIIIQAIAVILSATLISYFVLKAKRTLLLGSLILCQITIFLWSLGQIIELLAPTVEFKWRIVLLEYIPISYIGLFWFIFCMLYTGKEFIYKKVILILLFVVPVISYTMILTNKYHHLFYLSFHLTTRVYGILFWVHILINYVFLFTGAISIVSYTRNKAEIEKKQSLLLILTVVIPVTSNILVIFKIVSFGIDITPVSFAISLLLFSIAIFRYRFFNLATFALRGIVEDMVESIIVVDKYNKITDYNKSMVKEFSKYLSTRLNCEIVDISDFIDRIKEDIKNEKISKEIINDIKTNVNESIIGEIIVSSIEEKTYRVSIKPVKDKKHRVLGKIITFTDITNYKKLLDELQSKNQELLAMNEYLKEYSNTVEELAITKERNRFSMDMHDTLGHTLVMLNKLIEMGVILCDMDIEKAKETFEKARELSKEGANQIRESISGLVLENFTTQDIANSIRSMVSVFEKCGVKVNLIIDGSLESISSKYTNTIYRICQEALTNSQKHGKATEVNIILRFSDKVIQIYIIDNGVGCKRIDKGYGLNGMENRVIDLNGDIMVGSDGESGFNIHVELPYLGRKE